MRVLHLTPDEARSKVTDPVALRIAEALWTSYGYGDDDVREWVDSSDGDGQWNFCVKDALMLADLFRQMRDEPERS